MSISKNKRKLPTPYTYYRGEQGKWWSCDAVCSVLLDGGVRKDNNIVGVLRAKEIVHQQPSVVGAAARQGLRWCG